MNQLVYTIKESINLWNIIWDLLLTINANNSLNFKASKG